MKRLMIMSLAILFVTAAANAAVLDFDTTGQASDFSWAGGAATVTAGDLPAGGVGGGAGMELASGGQTDAAFTYGANTMADGYISADILVVGGGAYGPGTGLLLKTFADDGSGDDGAYVAYIRAYGSTLRIMVGVQDDIRAYEWGFDNVGHTGRIQDTSQSTPGADAWYNLKGIVATSGSNLVVTVELRDAGNTLLKTVTYTDSGSDAVTAAGGIGITGGHFGTDSTFDNIDIVPEPASMAVLGIGGLLMLIRRRKR